MYSVNGIDLPGSQYRELRDLVSLDSDEARKAFSDKALRPYDDPLLFNPNGVECYRSLRSHGLIDGLPINGGFVYDGVVTQAGIDFVNDIAEKERREADALKSERRHDYAVAAVSAAVSFALGVAAEHFIGIVALITG